MVTAPERYWWPPKPTIRASAIEDKLSMKAP